MIANTQKDTTLVAKDRIQELHRLLLQGEDFGNIAKQFSDDKSSSMRSGELKPFKSGQINSTLFENTAFSLKEKEDISEPIQTQFGWHILKLIDKQAVKEFNSLKLRFREPSSKRFTLSTRKIEDASQITVSVSTHWFKS